MIGERLSKDWKYIAHCGSKSLVLSTSFWRSLQVFGPISVMGSLGLLWARAARFFGFFKGFLTFWGPKPEKTRKNRWPAGECGSELAHSSLMIGNISEIDRLSKDWRNRWHNFGPP